MKQAILLLAVFLYLSAAAQLPVSFASNQIPAYYPVKFESLKKFKHPELSAGINTYTGSHLLTQSPTETPVYNFRMLQDYLSDDTRYFRLEQKKKEWTQFSSGSLNSWQKQQWLDNKYNIQQRWMMQKIKGK